MDRQPIETAPLPALQLTPRQRQVVELYSAGKMQKEIANELGITIHTVWFLLSTARKKLGVRNTRQLVALYSATVVNP